MAPERYSSSCPARARKYVRGDTDDRDPPALAARAVFAVIVYSSGAGPEAGESYRCRERKQRPRRPRASRSRRLDRAGAPRAGRGPVTGRADDGERARNRELRLPRGTEPNGTEQLADARHRHGVGGGGGGADKSSVASQSHIATTTRSRMGGKMQSMHGAKKRLHIFRSFFIREEKFMQISTHTHQSLIISAPNGGPIAIIAPAHQSPPSATTSSIVHHHQDQQRNHHHYRQQLAARSSTIPYHTSRQLLPPAGWCLVVAGWSSRPSSRARTRPVPPLACMLH